jgi:hypothetical protein
MTNPIRIVALLLLANILLTLITIGLVLAKNLGCSWPAQHRAQRSITRATL